MREESYINSLKACIRYILKLIIQLKSTQVIPGHMFNDKASGKNVFCSNTAKHKNDF